MKPILIAALLLIFTSARSLAGDASRPVLQSKQSDPVTWKRYTVPGEKFSVKLPTLPAMTTRKLLIHHLRKTRVERMIGVYADGVVYTIEVYENVERLTLAQFVAKQNVRGRWELATEQAIVLNDVAGKEYRSNDETLPATVRFFAPRDRLYQFVASGAAVDDVGVKQFFSSIALGSKNEGLEVSDGLGTPFEPDGPEETFSGKELDRRVRLAMKPEPTYTESARQGQITGTVVLRVVFSASGSVVDIEVRSGLPYGLTENAIEAARKIKFHPGIKNGKPVATKMQLEYNFNLY